MKDFLIEIFTEEIPSAFAVDAKENLLLIIKKIFTDKGVSFGESIAYVTPRRLAVVVSDVEEKSKDEVIEQKGPLYEAAFKDGAITKAGSGFFKANNLDESLIANLCIEEKTNAPYLKELGGKNYIFIKKEKVGIETSNIIKENFLHILDSIKFPKKMRWADYDFPFVRPIRNIVLMFGEDIIEVEVAGIKSNNNVYGHRLLSPEPTTITKPKDYEVILENKHVIPSREKRLADIIKQLEGIEKTTGLSALDKNKVSNIVVDLVEKPYLLKATFDEKFLEVPKEVLTSEMVEHQFYFPMADNSNKLVSTFIITANQPKTDHIINGNKRVLTARLSDGRFLYQEDIKNGLDNMNRKLATLMFRNKLGSMENKVSRMLKHAEFIINHLNLSSEQADKIRKAIKYMKADLVSNMVYNFPELQGIMGAYFAEEAGFDNEVVVAIREQYKPTSAKDSVPENVIGRVIASVDKIDNIIAGFYLNDIPTGSQDPNALRRQALGLINIIRRSEKNTDITKLVTACIENFREYEQLNKTEDLAGDILEFIKSRFENDISGTYSYDAIRGVLAMGLSDVNVSLSKIISIDKFRSLRENRFAELLTVFKRISNIIKNTTNYDINEILLTEQAEKELYRIYKEKSNTVKSFIDKKDYEGAFAELADLYQPIDGFFKDVMVMADDEKIKNNRIALLASVDLLFKNMLDFSVLTK